MRVVPALGDVGSKSCQGDHRRRFLDRLIYDNQMRPHSSLGANVPEPAGDLPVAPGPDVTGFQPGGASSRRPFLVAFITITGSTAPRSRGIRPQRSATFSPNYFKVPKVQQEASLPRTAPRGGFAERGLRPTFSGKTAIFILRTSGSRVEITMPQTR
jgi:hypothetical protein